MTGLKRRMRSHFWFPRMDAKIEEFVASCQHCTMYTSKRTRELLQPHSVSNEAWEDVSVDLFGPMPDRKHVLTVIDKSSRYPAAKVIPSTSAMAVTGALSQIYSDYMDILRSIKPTMAHHLHPQTSLTSVRTTESSMSEHIHTIPAEIQ